MIKILKALKDIASAFFILTGICTSFWIFVGITTLFSPSQSPYVKEHSRLSSPDKIFDAVLIERKKSIPGIIPGHNLLILPKGMNTSDRHSLAGSWFTPSNKILYRATVTREIIKWEDNNTIIISRYEDDPIFKFNPIYKFDHSGLKRTFLVKFVIVDGTGETNLY